MTAQEYKYMAIKKLDAGKLNDYEKEFIEKIRYYTINKLWQMSKKQYLLLRRIAINGT